MRKTIQGSLALLMATIIWGCAFVAQSVGMDHIGPFTFQSIRCFLGVLALIPVIFLFDLGKKDGKTFFSRWRCSALWRTGLLCGIALFTASGLQQIGLMDTDAGKAGFLTALYMIIVPILGLFFRKKLTIATCLGVLLAFLGLYLLSGAGGSSISAGDLCLIVCAVAFAVQITLIDRLGTSLDGLRLNCIQCFVCAALSALVMAFTESPTMPGVTACAVPLLYTGVLSMGIAYSLQIIGQQRVNATPASLIMSLESVFAMLAGWLLLQERMTSRELLGCSLMFAGIIFSQLPARNPS